MTSPRYNLGIQTARTTTRCHGIGIWHGPENGFDAPQVPLSPTGSLFLNVGAKPTDPWTAMDVAQAVRSYLQLENTIHSIKSIAIEKELAGSRAGLADDLAVGHDKPINSKRFLHDCHEFVFHFTRDGHTPRTRAALAEGTRIGPVAPMR